MKIRHLVPIVSFFVSATGFAAPSEAAQCDSSASEGVALSSEILLEEPTDGDLNPQPLPPIAPDSLDAAE